MREGSSVNRAGARKVVLDRAEKAFGDQLRGVSPQHQVSDIVNGVSRKIFGKDERGLQGLGA